MIWNLRRSPCGSDGQKQVGRQTGKLGHYQTSLLLRTDGEIQTRYLIGTRLEFCLPSLSPNKYQPTKFQGL